MRLDIAPGETNGVFYIVFDREGHILDFERSYAADTVTFYSSFVALSCNCLTNNASACTLE